MPKQEPHLARCNCVRCGKVPGSDRCIYCGNWTVDPVVERRAVRCRTCEAILRPRNSRGAKPLPIQRRWDDGSLRDQEFLERTGRRVEHA